MEENNKIGYIVAGIAVLIMGGMISFGFKMFKDTQGRMDKMENDFEKMKEEQRAEYEKKTEEMLYYEVPDVSGMKLDEAKARLTGSGFATGEVIEVKDETISKGKVVKTDPVAGTKAKMGTSVKIYVSE